MPQAYQFQDYHRLTSDVLPDEIDIIDHALGFDANGDNSLLTLLQQRAQDNDRCIKVNLVYPIPQHVRTKYHNLDVRFKFLYQRDHVWSTLHGATMMPEPRYTRFLCSFNGSLHVSRVLLTAILHKMQLWNQACTKGFVFTQDELDGHINGFCGSRARYFRKWFVGTNTGEFAVQQQTIHRKDKISLDRYGHGPNLAILQPVISGSFVNLVSETMATSAFPFVTEKFLYSVVTHGLFLAFAQPGWHRHLRDDFGFRLYDQVFDYSFDLEPNPVQRLVLLIRQLMMFSSLSHDDWHDLHRLERDNVDFNRQHFLSRDYLLDIGRLQDHDI